MKPSDRRRIKQTNNDNNEVPARSTAETQGAVGPMEQSFQVKSFPEKSSFHSNDRIIDRDANTSNTAISNTNLKPSERRRMRVDGDSSQLVSKQDDFVPTPKDDRLMNVQNTRDNQTINAASFNNTTRNETQRQQLTDYSQHYEVINHRNETRSTESVDSRSDSKDFNLNRSNSQTASNMKPSERRRAQARSNDANAEISKNNNYKAEPVKPSSAAAETLSTSNEPRRPSERKRQPTGEATSNQQSSNDAPASSSAGQATAPTPSQKWDKKLPANWTPISPEEKGKKHWKAVTLDSTDQEYIDIEREFLDGLGNASAKVQQIDRIQNPSFFYQYMAKKEGMDRGNPKGTKNERCLWHGTAVRKTQLGLLPIVNINARGFNRSYNSSANTTDYGDGVYFNTFIKKAANFAKPDDEGNCYMYRCRVLTGEYTKGSKGLKDPPLKSDQMQEWFDSVVDDMSQPSTFVIFHDAQAYPEYLIIYKTS